MEKSEQQYVQQQIAMREGRVPDQYGKENSPARDHDCSLANFRQEKAWQSSKFSSRQELPKLPELSIDVADHRIQKHKAVLRLTHN